MLYGEQWRPAAAVLPTVCIASILVLAATPYHQALMASQRVRLFFLCETGLLLNWLALLLVATPLGLQAVAWAYVAGTLVGAVVYVIALRLAIGLRLRDLAAVWWRSGVPALAVGVVAALMRLSPLATAWPLPFVLLLTGVLGGSVWLGAIWLVRHEFRDHAIDLLRWGWARLRTIRP
jgi:O-antigen/teichoic acid export membrane protein